MRTRTLTGTEPKERAYYNSVMVITSSRLSLDKIKSNQIKSNQIKSNQIKSNQIRWNSIPEVHSFLIQYTQLFCTYWAFKQKLFKVIEYTRIGLGNERNRHPTFTSTTCTTNTMRVV